MKKKSVPAAGMLKVEIVLNSIAAYAFSSMYYLNHVIHSLYSLKFLAMVEIEFVTG